MPAPCPPFFTAFALLSLATLTTACGREKAEVTVSKDGEAVYHTSGEGAEIQVADEGESLDVAGELPAFAPLYPGASVKTRLADVAGSGKDGAKGGMWMLETSDPVEKVAAFYDEQARIAGVKPGMVVNEKDSAVRIFGSAGEGKGGKSKDRAEGALIAISHDETDKLTKIVITAGSAVSRADGVAAADIPEPMRAAPQRLQ